MKKLLTTIVSNLIVFVGLIVLFGAIIFFIWNTAVVWAIPRLGSMDLLQAFGVAALFAILNSLVTYWTNRFIEIKKLKSLEALQIASSLNKELIFVKGVLYEKGIINDVDLQAMELIKDAR
jgi:hypothetical protein